jgi:erythromycin esterase-like protein
MPLRRHEDLQPLVDRIGDARFVLLGEASHGTAEYYNWRAALSRMLITQKDFRFVAVEGDWPDCYRVNRYVRGLPDSGANAREVLHAFDRWPTWMWANEEVVAFADWLRARNDGLDESRHAGFYGLDVYSLWDSLRAVLDYLRREESEDAVEAARRAFRCFEPFGEDVQQYAWNTLMVPDTCEDAVVKMLAALRREAAAFDGDGGESYFNAEQNAVVAKNAERYYRAMVRGGATSWNVRDTHMIETLERLARHFGDGAKAIVWEHNTHVGDARFTDMAAAGMNNVGEMARQRFDQDGVVLVGFGGHRGTVIAGREWDAPMEVMPVPEAMRGSWEDVIHRASPTDQMLFMTDLQRSEDAVRQRGHRAIGVVYDPDRERGNYVPTVLPRRYDAFLYFDETHAVHPLHMKSVTGGEVPETYPTGV